MKTTIRSTSLKAMLLIAPISFYFSAAAFGQGKDRDLTLAAVTPVVTKSNADLRPTSPQGYLKVYSATDAFNDGDAWYFPHSSYSVYTTNGKLAKNVSNHISRSDEIPEIVTLPVGVYIVDARSEQDGYVRVRVVIRPGRKTTLTLDLRENQRPRMAAR